MSSVNLIVSLLLISTTFGTKVEISLQDQKKHLLEEQLQCLKVIMNYTVVNASGCAPVWDGILCWPATPSGSQMSRTCPDYIDGFENDANATKACLHDGSWYIHPNLNRTWTNYTQCSAVKNENNLVTYPDFLVEHLHRIEMMYNIGYGISLVSLVLAVGIMIYFRRLYCSRNFIHINLFLSLILRALISFLKENLLVKGVAFASDVRERPDGKLEFIEEGQHWECKLFFTVFNYLLAANYLWILVEGLYLQLLLSFNTFSDRTGIRWCIVFGWVGPLTFVCPWVAVRATLEDKLCWNTHPTSGYFWIMRGPIVASIVVNFIFFLNILRVLITKLNDSRSPDSKTVRYKKMAKSTLVLIPLFGVHYIVFLGLPNNVNQDVEIVRLYYEMFFNSFQGLFVALLFCFLNGEVQTEIKKKWYRYKLRRGGNSNRRFHRDTVTSFAPSSRGSPNAKDFISSTKHDVPASKELKPLHFIKENSEHDNITQNGDCRTGLLSSTLDQLPANKQNHYGRDSRSESCMGNYTEKG